VIEPVGAAARARSALGVPDGPSGAPVAEFVASDEDGVMAHNTEVAAVGAGAAGEPDGTGHGTEERGSDDTATAVVEGGAGDDGDDTAAADVDGTTDDGGPSTTDEVAPDADAGADELPAGTDEAGTTPPQRVTGDYRMAVVSSVALDLPHQHPAVVLRETEAPRRQLTFSVGLQDGIALSHALRRVPTPRPLTHELMADVLAGFDIDLVAVRLVGRQGSTYFAELDLRGRNGRSVHSCRPTDALTLALRQPVPVPILIDSRLFESSGDVAPPV